MHDSAMNTVAPRESALTGHLVPGQYGRVGTPGITMREIPDLLVYQLAAWSHSVEQVRHIACQLAGIAENPGVRSATIGQSGCLLHVEPLKWWLLGNATVLLAPEQGCVLDISQSRTCLYVSGEHATTLLNRHLPIDLRDKSCPIDAVFSTGFHHVGVTAWRRQDGFALFVPRSFAVSLFTLLCESAEQFGFELLENSRMPPWQPD